MMSVLQSYVSYFFTKIHSVISQMTCNSTHLNVCIVENYVHITVLWINGLTALLLVPRREELVVVCAVTAELVHPSISM
jgi:hypothetical protein